LFVISYHQTVLIQKTLKKQII